MDRGLGKPRHFNGAVQSAGKNQVSFIRYAFCKLHRCRPGIKINAVVGTQQRNSLLGNQLFFGNISLGSKRIVIVCTDHLLYGFRPAKYPYNFISLIHYFQVISKGCLGKGRKTCLQGAKADRAFRINQIHDCFPSCCCFHV